MIAKRFACLTGVMEFALKHVFARDIMPYLRDIAELLHNIEVKGGGEYVAIMLQYWFTRGEIKDKKAFFELIKEKISPDIGEKTMTLAEQYYAEGKEKGKAEGKAEGEAQKSIEIAKHLLIEGVDVMFIAKITGLSLATIKEM